MQKKFIFPKIKKILGWRLLSSFFIKNFPQKIAAVILAIVIWVFVGNQNPLDTTEYQISVPISYTNIPKDLAVVSPLVENVNFRVTAQKQDRSSIKPSNFQVIVDLQKIQEGENEILLTSSLIQSDVNYNLIALLPNRLNIVTEPTVEKIVPIRITLVDNLGDNTVIIEIQKTPNFVSIKGARSIVKNLEYIETLPVEIANDRISSENSYEFVVSLQPPPNVILLETIENVSGTIFLGAEVGNLLVENVPVFTAGGSFETRINPKIINLLLSGAKPILQKINKKNIKAYIRLSNYKPGKYVIKDFDLNLSSEILIKRAWPPIDVWILENKKKQP